jgi:hypothetical protein
VKTTALGAAILLDLLIGFGSGAGEEDTDADAAFLRSVRFEIST